MDTLFISLRLLFVVCTYGLNSSIKGNAQQLSDTKLENAKKFEEDNVNSIIVARLLHLQFYVVRKSTFYPQEQQLIQKRVKQLVHFSGLSKIRR
jgi:hypothetical protein